MLTTHSYALFFFPCFLLESSPLALALAQSNAGIYAEADVPPSVADHPTAIYDLTMDVNVKGIYFGTKYAARSMMKRKAEESASVINTSSIAGLSGNVGTFVCESPVVSSLSL